VWYTHDGPSLGTWVAAIPTSLNVMDGASCLEATRHDALIVSCVGEWAWASTRYAVSCVATCSRSWWHILQNQDKMDSGRQIRMWM
jgi:hypothetical protein